MKIFLTDFLYSLFVNGIDKEFALSLFDNDIDLLYESVDRIFSIQYRQDICNELGVNRTTRNTQKPINQIFKTFAETFHSHINPEYLLSRNITEEQIIKYKLGSTHCLKDETIVNELFVELKKRFDETLVKDIFNYHLHISLLNDELYENPYMSTIPSFNYNNECEGIVYRTENYKKLNSLRNLSKFYCSHAPTYIFNHETINRYDELIIVEGVFDVLALERIGILNAITVSYNRLSKYHYNLLKDKKLKLIFDPDVGGLAGLQFIKETYNFKDIEYHLTPDNMDVDELVTENKFLEFYETIK